MGVAGMVLGIVACSLWLIHRRRVKQITAVINAHATIIQQLADQVNDGLKVIGERFETHLGRLNDLQRLLDTSVRVNDAHSEQIVGLCQRVDGLDKILLHRSFTAECDPSEPSDGPLYLALRYERHHTKRPSGEVGKMPVFSSVELIQAKYGPNCGYKRLDLPEGGR